MYNIVIKLLKTINPRKVPKDELEKYSIRETARGIILDDNGKVEVIYVSKYDVYQLIGGGIDKGETREDGLKRESKEEAGVEIEIIQELWLIIEIIKESKAIQKSYCYISKVTGKKGKAKFTSEEKENGFETKWIDFDFLEKETGIIKFRIPEVEYSYIRTKTILGEYKKNKIFS